MGFLDKAKQVLGQAKDKGTQVAGEVVEKAGPLAEKAGGMAAKGVDAAASGVDKATGGKYHDKIQNVSSKVEGVLDPHKGSGEAGPEASPRPPDR